MNVSATARRIYRAIKCNASMIARYRAEELSLIESLGLSPDAAFELTSSTTNGQTFSGRRTSTEEERFILVSMVLWQIDNETALPSVTRIRF